MSTNGDEESTTPSAPSAPSAPASVSSAPRFVASKRASWLVLLALLNVVGAALLFFAVTKGEQATSQWGYGYGCPTVIPASPHLFDNSVTSIGPNSGRVDCGKPFAEPFWGLGAAPVVAVIVSGFLMSVLYDRRQRRLAVLQTGFFVLALAYAVYGVSSLVDYWV
jgi:hypothetical protein